MASQTREGAGISPEQLRDRARFLARHEPFKGLSGDELTRVAESVESRVVHAGDTILVESGPPGTQLYVVRHGAVELLHKEALVAVAASGEVIGYPTLLTGLSPEFTVRARDDSLLYCIPHDVALEVLGRPEGVRYVAGNARERLIQSARIMRSLPQVRTRPVTSLVRSKPLFCEPDTPIRDAAKILMDEGRSAILVPLPDDGLGIVTDRDFRDKVVIGDVSPDAPVSAIMTTPVHTIGTEVLAPEASIAMMTAGVNHLPVLDSGGRVVGVVSASSLMALDARSPFALRRSIQGAHNEDELVQAAADMPYLFVDLLDAHLDAPALTRVLTVLSDAMTGRLMELAIDKQGEAPVAYAWLAFGSSARSELTLASDQDNGLAYADTDDPAVDQYFRRVAQDVNRGLERCGFPLDPHGVQARSPQWRMSLSKWEAVFRDVLEGRDFERLARSSVSFDFRQVAGELYIDLALTEIMRQAPEHRTFMKGLERLGTGMRLPLTFRQRLEGWIDIKKDCLVPIQNLARYWAFSRGVTAHSTLERLAAVHEVDGQESDAERSLREAYTSVLHLQLRHHANAIRAGRTPDNVIDASKLRPLTRATLQEALREVASAQRRFPRLAGLY